MFHSYMNQPIDLQLQINGLVSIRLESMLKEN